MTLALGNHTSNSVATATTTIALTLTASAGSLILLSQITDGGTGASSAPSDTSSLQWNHATSFPVLVASRPGVDLYWAYTALGVTSDVITANHNQNDGAWGAIAFEVSGANTTTPFDTNASLPKSGNGSSTGPPATTGVSTDYANDMLVSLAGVNAQYAITQPSAWSLIEHPSRSVYGGAAACKIVTATQSSVTVTWGSGFSGTQKWISVVTAIKEATQYVTGGLAGQASGAIGEVDAVASSSTHGQLISDIIASSAGVSSAQGQIESQVVASSPSSSSIAASISANVTIYNPVVVSAQPNIAISVLQAGYGSGLL